MDFLFLNTVKIKIQNYDGAIGFEFIEFFLLIWVGDLAKEGILYFD